MNRIKFAMYVNDVGQGYTKYYNFVALLNKYLEDENYVNVFNMTVISNTEEGLDFIKSNITTNDLVEYVLIDGGRFSNDNGRSTENLIKITDQYDYLFITDPYMRTQRPEYKQPYEDLSKATKLIYCEYGLDWINDDSWLATQDVNTYAHVNVRSNVRSVLKTSRHNQVLDSGKKYDVKWILGKPYLDMYNYNNTKKYIIVAPHHSIDEKVVVAADNFGLFGNILEYFDQLCELPKEYPQYQFVFKPHPALFKKLEICGRDPDAMWNKLKSLGYIILSQEENYIPYFNDAAAIITDSISFIGESLCTGAKLYYLVAEKDGNISKSSIKHLDRYLSAWTKVNYRVTPISVALRDISEYDETSIMIHHALAMDFKKNYNHSSNLLQHIIKDYCGG